MRLRLENKDFVQIINGKASVKSTEVVDAIAYDSRKIGDAANTVFIALKGENSDGHQFIQSAYDKGIRSFVVSDKKLINLPEAQYIYVENTWNALFSLAQHQRELFKGFIVSISGKTGKTTVKEWLYHLLSPEKKISRSPKSFNSQLGIALSILELKTTSEIGIIEIKPHEDLDPELVNKMVQPTMGIWTSSENTNYPYMSNEFVAALFKGANSLIHANDNRNFKGLKDTKIILTSLLKKDDSTPDILENGSNLLNASLAFCAANEIVHNKEMLNEKLKSLSSLALRMETFDGINGNFIINDAYNLDFDAFRNSLEFQQSISKGMKRAVIVGLTESSVALKDDLLKLINEFSPDYVQVLENESDFNLKLENTIVLLKGTRDSGIHRVANRFKIKRHKTHIQVDLKALRKNISAHRQMVPKETKIMAMVKAAGYGSGLQKMAQFVDTFGVDYYGVAYVDEGVEIRNAGIKKPIMVMNAEDGNFESCIQNQLEPAIYDFQQLDEFISECIYQGVENYPIHLKIDTGMNRLGFRLSDVDRVLEIIQSQPEVKIQSVYSHLSDADNRRDRRFTEHQIQSFSSVIKKIQNELSYTIESHILNSAGIANYPEASFSMVRIGIGMYGVTSNPELKRKLVPVLSWYSSVSQIKQVQKGQSVGYSRSFISDKEMSIATIPVGYADGYRRSLSNGKGYVFINEKKCFTIGRVCMDMIMVDVTGLNVKVGDEVEIIGPTLTLEKMAELQETIPYEIMTSISSRVHRSYIE